MPSPWNDATDRQLLLTIIHLTAPSLPEWNKVALLMGEGFTAESTRQHFQKLRKNSKEVFGDVSEAAAEEGKKAPKGTPRKGSKAAAAAGTGDGETLWSKKRKGRKDVGAEGGDDEEMESPSKKTKVKREKGEDSE